MLKALLRSSSLFSIVLTRMQMLLPGAQRIKVMRSKATKKKEHLIQHRKAASYKPEEIKLSDTLMSGHLAHKEEYFWH